MCDETTSTDLIHWIFKENSVSPPVPPIPVKWTAPRLTQNMQDRQTQVRARPASAAGKLRDTEGITRSRWRLPLHWILHRTHNYSTRWSHNAPQIHDTLRRAASTAAAVLLATLLFQAPSLSPSLSLSLFLGSCSSAPQERGGGDWEPLYFSPLLSLSALAPPLSMSLFSLTFIHIFHPLLSSLTSPTSGFSQSVLAPSHLQLLSLLLKLNIPTGKKQNFFF